MTYIIWFPDKFGVFHLDYCISTAGDWSTCCNSHDLSWHYCLSWLEKQTQNRQLMHSAVAKAKSAGDETSLETAIKVWNIILSGPMQQKFLTNPCTHTKETLTWVKLTLHVLEGDDYWMYSLGMLLPLSRTAPTLATPASYSNQVKFLFFKLTFLTSVKWFNKKGRPYDIMTEIYKKAISW